MKRRICSIVLLLLGHQSAQSFSVFNAPFAFERRYGANSFIFNSKLYYEQYQPKKQHLGNSAITNLKEKRERKARKGRRLFTRYAPMKSPS